MKNTRLVGAFLALLMTISTQQIHAQGAQVPFAALETGADTKVEVTADSLGIDQKTGKAVFSGNVVIGINDMRMTADKVEVVYSDLAAAATGAISSLKASGHVTFVRGEEAAEADFADVDLDARIIIMTGNVILTQGGNALSGEKLRVDLNANTALMEGRVQTILQTNSLPQSGSAN